MMSGQFNVPLGSDRPFIDMERTGKHPFFGMPLYLMQSVMRLSQRSKADHRRGVLY